jgi:hypothetical protein
MKKPLFPRLALTIVLAVAVSIVMAAPAMAQPIPPDANANEIGIGIMTGPGGPYYYGDTIDYTVRVYVPAASDSFKPAQQTDIETHLVLPDGTDINLGTIPVLNPGETHFFTAVPYVVDPLDVVGDMVFASAYCDGTAQLLPPVPSHADVEVNTRIESFEVGGAVLPVNKLMLLAPWAVLVGALGVMTLFMIRKKRQA